MGIAIREGNFGPIGIRFDDRKIIVRKFEAATGKNKTAHVLAFGGIQGAGIGQSIDAKNAQGQIAQRDARLSKYIKHNAFAIREYIPVYGTLAVGL